MAEGTCPQVFVVDRQIQYASPPIKPKQFWKRAGGNLVLVVLGLVVCGLVLEGIFIYRLSKRTEIFYQSSQTHNQSSFQTPALDGNIMGQQGTLESNEVRLNPEKIHQRPMAHLQGSNTVGKDGVVQWTMHNNGFTKNMEFNSSGLVIKTQGYYYLYSKVHFEEMKDCAKGLCVLVSHKVFKNITQYGLPMELMRSTRLYCCQANTKNNGRIPDKYLWNSFLAGLFELKPGDHIFVTLDKGLYGGPDDNFFGAFMMS